MRPRPVPRIGCVALLLALAACSETPYAEVDLEKASSESRTTAPREQPAPSLRFAVAAIESPRDTFATYARLIETLGAHLGRKVELVQRRTYEEVNGLLATGQVDAALVCAGGFLDLRRRDPTSVEVLAVPVIDGRSTFRSVIIVPLRSPATSIEDLAGKRFAYTDALSLSGRDYPRWLLKQRGRDPDRFFGSTMLTGSHDRSVASVAKGLIDGAAVHSRIYEHLLRDEPELAGKTRVIHRSPEFGSTPVVASTKLPPELRARLRDILLSLHADPDAPAALRVLNIDRFAAPTPGMFEQASQIVESSR